MKLLGSILAITGAAVSVASFFLRTSVLTVYGDGSRTINIGLLQNQLLTFQSGCVLFLAGVVLHAAAAVLEGRSAPAEIDPGSPTEKPTFSSADVVKAGIGIVLLVAIIGWYATRPTASNAAAEAEMRANIVMKADQLEVQADNMEAAAEAVSIAAPSSVPTADEPIVQEEETPVAAEEKTVVDQSSADTTDEEASADIFDRLDR